MGGKEGGREGRNLRYAGRRKEGNSEEKRNEEGFNCFLYRVVRKISTKRKVSYCFLSFPQLSSSPLLLLLCIFLQLFL